MKVKSAKCGSIKKEGKKKERKKETKQIRIQ